MVCTPPTLPHPQTIYTDLGKSSGTKKKKSQITTIISLDIVSLSVFCVYRLFQLISYLLASVGVWSLPKAGCQKREEQLSGWEWGLERQRPPPGRGVPCLNGPPNEASLHPLVPIPAPPNTQLYSHGSIYHHETILTCHSHLLCWSASSITAEASCDLFILMFLARNRHCMLVVIYTLSIAPRTLPSL